MKLVAMAQQGLSLGIFVIAAVIGTSVPARAEWAIDLYGGAAWTDSTNLDVSGRDDTGASIQSTIFDIKTDTGYTVGARVGYWFESLPVLGLSLDTFYFSIPLPAQTLSATATFSGEFLGRPITFTATGEAQVPAVDLPAAAFSPQVSLRWPLLVSQEFPKGRLQPYIGAGPAWAFTVDSDRLDVELGAEARAGAALHVVSYLALFAEYRYVTFPGFEVVARGLAYTVDINSNQAVLGLSFRF